MNLQIKNQQPVRRSLGEGGSSLINRQSNLTLCGVLPISLRDEVAKQIERARVIWSCRRLRLTRSGDRESGLAGVYMPGALARKFRRAAETFEWFWLFPARQTSVDPESGLVRRHHLHGQVYNEAVKRAAAAAGIEKRVTSHALRH